MILIVCVDDHNGMMFNHRRQSQDRVLRADILELTDGKKLWMNAYSRKQFAESDAEKIRVDETFLDAAGNGEFCFVENGIIPRMCIFRWISACGSAWRRKNLRALPMRKLPERDIPGKI